MEVGRRLAGERGLGRAAAVRRGECEARGWRTAGPKEEPEEEEGVAEEEEKATARGTSASAPWSCGTAACV